MNEEKRWDLPSLKITALYHVSSLLQLLAQGWTEITYEMLGRGEQIRDVLTHDDVQTIMQWMVETATLYERFEGSKYTEMIRKERENLIDACVEDSLETMFGMVQTNLEDPAYLYRVLCASRSLIPILRTKMIQEGIS